MLAAAFFVVLLTPVFGQHGEEAPTAHTVSMEMNSHRLSCTNATVITSLIRETAERQDINVEAVVLNCCVEGPETTLSQAVVSVFEANGNVSGGFRYEINQREGVAVVLAVPDSMALNFTWDNKKPCYLCNTTSNIGAEMCSPCHEFCEVCVGPNNSRENCTVCKYDINGTNVENGYCASDCLHGFTKSSHCEKCPTGYYFNVLNDTTMKEEGMYPFESYELECVQTCPEGLEHTEVEGSKTEFCFDSGIAYCKKASSQHECEECYHGTELLPELYTEKKFDELKEEIEELRHELEELKHESQTEEEKKEFEHFLEEFEEKCVGPVHCLTEEEIQECFQGSVALQSTVLFLEFEVEEAKRQTKDIALGVSLTVVCLAIIAFFVGFSVFAHFRYPHVHENKRRRKEVPPEKNEINAVWRPRPTVHYK